MLVVGGTPAEMRIGIAVGVLSAFLVAIFGSLNKRYVEHGEPLCVTGVELAAGTAFLTLVAVIVPGVSASLVLPGPRDSCCCSCSHSHARCFHSRWPSWRCAVSVPSVHNWPISLEPVYAVVLAILLLGEQRELGIAVLPGSCDHPGGRLCARGPAARTPAAESLK